jgi:PTS system cellobiose-specific IIC component
MPVHQLWQKIVALMEAASKQRHMIALRDGMIGSVPIILVGSTFLLLGAQTEVIKYTFLNGSAFQSWYESMVPSLMLPYRFTMGLLALYVSFTIAAALAREYGMPPIPNGLTAMACLMLTGNMVRVTLPEAEKPEWVLAVKPLGAEGLFLAIILGLLTVEVSRKLTYMPRSKDGEDATGGVPPAVVQAFASFLPMLACVFLIWLLRHGLGVDIHHFIMQQTEWIKVLGDTFVAVLVVNLLLHLFGVAGVHGISVINAAMLPIWIQFLTANADAHAAGQAMPHVTAYPFYQWFIWIGGAGATLAPTVRCMFSKNPHVRRIGRVSIVPGMFNINEPLLFGLPVVANPVLAIPFIVAPLACGAVAFFATSWGLVGKAFIEAPWVMPCFLGAYLSTSDLKAVLLLAVNFCLSYAIWAPFLSAYEHRLATGQAEQPPAEGERPPGSAEPASAQPAAQQPDGESSLSTS